MLWGLEEIWQRRNDEITINLPQEKEKKSDMWSQKNTTHCIIGVITFPWTISYQEDMKWYPQVDERRSTVTHPLWGWRFHLSQNQVVTFPFKNP